jgi:predicted permease
MTSLLLDLRYAVRLLVKQRAFTIAAVATLAGVIAANTAIFSLIDGVLLRPLSLPHPEQIVRVEERHRSARTNLSGATVADLSERTRVFRAVGSFRIGSPGLSAGAAPEQIVSAEVSPGYFEVLGVPAALGRLLQPDDFAAGAGRAAVISDGLWRRLLGAERTAIGRIVRLNAVETEIVGVMPPRIYAPGSPQLWIARTPAQALTQNRRAHLFYTIGRLADGQTIGSAQAELQTIARGILADSGGVDPEMDLIATDLHARTVEGVRPALLMLWGAVALVLLAGAANIANLLLMQGVSRVRELSIRTALGAGRGRLIRQLTLESALLGLTGGALGTLLGIWAVPVLATAVPATLPLTATLEPGWRAAVFGVALSLAVSVLFGVMPALRASRQQPVAALRARTTGAAASGRLRSVLVAAEICTTVILLAAAALLGRSFLSATRVGLGFDPRNTLAFDLSLPSARYPNAAAHTAFYDRLLERLESQPGVVAVGASGTLPMIGGAATTMDPEQSSLRTPVVADVMNATPGIFAALKIPLRRGRLFTAEDRAGSPPVMVISETAAKQLWPDGGDPIGRGVIMRDWGNPYRAVVVGVVGDVRQRGPEQSIHPAVYYPLAQFPELTLRESVAVRTQGDPLTLATLVREHVRVVDSDQAVASMRTMEDSVTTVMAQRRFNLLLIAAFAVAALVLAGIGIYGVVAFAIGQRLHDIAVRVALGATRRDVARLSAAQGAAPVAAGLAAGLAGALLASRLLQRLLFETRATDPLTLVAVLAAVAAVAAVACIGPTRRALRIDPIALLRE